jgi:hypothetical protein
MTAPMWRALASGECVGNFHSIEPLRRWPDADVNGATAIALAL